MKSGSTVQNTHGGGNSGSYTYTQSSTIESQKMGNGFISEKQNQTNRRILTNKSEDDLEEDLENKQIQ